MILEELPWRSYCVELHEEWNRYRVPATLWNKLWTGQVAEDREFRGVRRRVGIFQVAQPAFRILFDILLEGKHDNLTLK